VAAEQHGERLIPGWVRPHRGEQRWSVMAVVGVAIALQLVLPDQFVLKPRTAAPILEGVLCVILIVSDPGRLNNRHPRLRMLSLVVIGLLALTNAVSTVLLVHGILAGTNFSATKILASGAAIWITNVIVYALWYWEFDRGGPVERAIAPSHTPDFLFPQMTDDRIQPRGWRPQFIDYLYVSLTNAAAFSPTDTMPLTPMAKIIMGVQSLVSLVTIGLIVSRAVNILA
jgi:uncharacterized membrane protein